MPSKTSLELPRISISLQKKDKIKDSSLNLPDSKSSLDLSSDLLKSEQETKGTRKKKSKNSIYQIVIMKIFFIKKKRRNSKNSKSSKSKKLHKIPESPETKSIDSSSEKSVDSEQTENPPKPSIEFVFKVTDFDEEQLTKAKSFIKVSKYSEALLILEPISNLSHQVTRTRPDYEILFWIGYCHEYLKNFDSAEKYYKLCADYILDDGYWETNYAKFLLENSNFYNNNRKMIESGMRRLLSAANKKKYVSAMYILGKIYVNGLYNINQDLARGEIYLKRAYNGGDEDRAWAIYEKKAKELVSNGKLSKVPNKNVWAKT